MQKTALREEVSSLDLRNTEDEMPEGYLFEHVGA